jgi:4-aminobutyrate aminotransferase/(S)-3-amino-2-methylpropionate transaminase
MWAVEQYAGAEPDMTVFGKSIGGGLPLAGVTGGAEVMDAVPPGGLGGTFGGNPLSCAAALAVLDVVSEPEFLAGARQLGEALRGRLDDIAARTPDIGEVRGLGSMLAFEFTERTPERAKAVVDAAFERGLILLSCGLYGNVIRLLPPLNIAADELDEGLAILEESLGA